MAPRTLLDKVWDAHLVATDGNGEDLLYIDRHLLHEVFSPKAFTELASRGRRMRRPDLTVGFSDHLVSTGVGRRGADDEAGQALLDSFRASTRAHEITHLDVEDPDQGIVHVAAPELGVVWPGMTVVCGDSHTCTLGALGAIAWGIGTSEITHVLAHQTIFQPRPAVTKVEIDGRLAGHASAKDVALAVVRQLGVDGGHGRALEFVGDTVDGFTMDERLTLCNMSVETGAKIGYVNPDTTTARFLAERAEAGPGDESRWRGLRSDPGAGYAETVSIDVSALRPLVTWGLRPNESVSVGSSVPASAQLAGTTEQRFARVLEYMGLLPGQALRELKVDVVFIGSCTNSRISDLRAAARVVDGRKVAPGTRAVVVPGSGRVRRQSEEEGLHEVFRRAGFEWREPGCSFCVSINGDRVGPGARAVSTSNRNFEGRQGPASRTHLASPAVAAACAVAGVIIGPEEL